MYSNNKDTSFTSKQERRKNKPEKWLLQNAKKRAKEKNIPFNISIERHNCSRCVPRFVSLLLLVIL